MERIGIQIKVHPVDTYFFLKLRQGPFKPDYQIRSMHEPDEEKRLPPIKRNRV
jgi:hypothetical protein